MAVSLKEMSPKNSLVETEIYTYGFQIILGSLVNIALLVIVSILFGFLNILLISLPVFIVFRYYAGGVHANSFCCCVVIGVSLFVTIGMVGQIALTTQILYYFIIVTFLSWTLLIIKKVPVYTEKKEITDNNIRINQKKKVAVVLLCWLVGTVVLVQQDMLQGAFASILGAIASLFLVTSLGKYFVSKVDQIYSYFSRGGESSNG